MRHLAFAGLLGLVASCQYDLGKVYDYGRSDAASTAEDGSVVPSGRSGQRLIDQFSEAPFVDETCRECVNAKCGDAEGRCTKSEECRALLACAAEKIDPERLASCRQGFAAWCAEDVAARTLAGPFYGCAFRELCADACRANSDWSCLGKYAWPKTAEKSVRSRIRFADGVSDKPAAGLTVKVFRQLGNSLTDEPASTAKADANGMVELDLPTPLGAFLGYLLVEGDDWYPTLVQFGYPIVYGGVTQVLIISRFNVEASVTSAGTQQLDYLGQLQLRMFGCAGVPMRDVSFETDMVDEKASRTWYFDGQRANTGIEKTTPWGNGGIVNVIPGPRVVRAKLEKRLVATTSAPVRAGYLTIVLLAPLDSSQM